MLGDPLEREAAAAAKCLGIIGGVGDEFFARAANVLGGGKKRPPLLKKSMSRWV